MIFFGTGQCWDGVQDLWEPYLSTLSSCMGPRTVLSYLVLSLQSLYEVNEMIYFPSFSGQFFSHYISKLFESS